jgi:hypothetical protein
MSLYPLSNTLHEGPNKSKRAKPYYDRAWFIAAELIVIVLAILCCLDAGGCF